MSNYDEIDNCNFSQPCFNTIITQNFNSEAVLPMSTQTHLGKTNQRLQLASGNRRTISRLMVLTQVQIELLQ